MRRASRRLGSQGPFGAILLLFSLIISVCWWIVPCEPNLVEFIQLLHMQTHHQPPWHPRCFAGKKIKPRRKAPSSLLPMGSSVGLTGVNHNIERSACLGFGLIQPTFNAQLWEIMEFWKYFVSDLLAFLGWSLLCEPLVSPLPWLQSKQQSFWALDQASSKSTELAVGVIQKGETLR